MEYEVGNIHYIVDRTDTDGTERFFEPVGRLCDCYSFDAYASISRACLSILYNYFNRKIIAIHLEILYARFGERDILALCLVISIEISCNAVVTSAISSVWCDVHFNKGVIFHTKIFFCRHTYWCVSWKNHDTIVVRAYTNLVFCTNHTE